MSSDLHLDSISQSRNPSYDLHLDKFEKTAKDLSRAIGGISRDLQKDLSALSLLCLVGSQLKKSPHRHSQERELFVRLAKVAADGLKPSEEEMEAFRKEYGSYFENEKIKKMMEKFTK